ncbi:Homeodomain-interacting protein kinase 3 [Mortierella sp. AM989]|nr:Homeodomain-interacting protein kinase 3 [Mortierella sp. AM989]
MSSFQEGMRQDPVALNAAAVVSVPDAPDLIDYSYGLDQDPSRSSAASSYSKQPNQQLQHRPGKHSDKSTGHVGIMIDDHQNLDETHAYGAQGTHNLVFDQGHTPSGSPAMGHQGKLHVEPLPPPATSSRSSRGSQYSGLFQQGYSQYHGQLPGATLSRHLSIQLSPNATLLPPPPPAVHSGSHANNAPYSMEGSPTQARDYVAPPPPAATSSQSAAPLRAFQPSTQQIQSQQYLQHQPQQQHSPSQQSVAVPPPPIKYIRSPMRSPKMPQLSSQAMAHAQAQSQAQLQSQSHYRQHHSSYNHPPPTNQGQQHFPPRTHRRSIQPLTLDQQQPKGGSFRYVRNQADLWPQKGSQKYRSIDAYGQSISPLRALTELLTKTYSHCNREFKYEPSYNPRRVLTKPSKPMHNEGYDNEDYDYILYVSDILGSEERQRYLILDVLGQGTFGQVVKCQNLKTNAIVAVKVIKNKPAYFNQSMMEVTVLELLNERYDMDDRHHILRLQDTFIHRRHLCLVFELLSVNLYELIKQNQFRGLSMSLVRVFTAQLLDALCVLNEARIIHCDLKPENVLLKNLETPTIKVIDFGSACHEQQTVYTYIQSRFYRSPEVLVGLPYSSSIDIWSVGCIAAELFLGLPLFPGSSEYNQLSRIVEMLGMLPTYMLDIGKTAHEFFEVVRPDHTAHNFNRPTQKKYRLKSMELYSREHGVVEQPSKRYFQATTLPDIVNSYPMLKKSMTPKEIEKETLNRQSFINFLQGLLNLNPIERWSPHQAKLHPFITGDPFNGSFIPPTIPKKPATAENSARLEPTLPGKPSKARSASLSLSSSTSTLTSTLKNESSTIPGKQPQPDHPLIATGADAASNQPQPSKNDRTNPSGTVAGQPLSTLGVSAATFSDGSLDPLATGASSLSTSPSIMSTTQFNTGASSATTASTGSAGATTAGTGVTFAPDTRVQDSPGTYSAAKNPPSTSHHHGYRPRATTMGTVEVPKNMAQLAAAMTPQQGQPSSGIGGSSSLSHRVGPSDPSVAIFEPSMPFSETEEMYSGGSGSTYGLRRIPERSEQNSPVQGTSGANSGISSQSSSGAPSPLNSTNDMRSKLSQHQSLHLQQPHRYLQRSGSDGGGKGATRTLRNAVEGTSGVGKDSQRAKVYRQSGSFVGASSSNTSGPPASNIVELTPLQRMQQQLIQSQLSQQQQQQLQQERNLHSFGYSQSGSSLSEGTGSSSGINSNNSSQQDLLSGPDYEAGGGTLRMRQMDLNSDRSIGSDSPAAYGDEMEEMDDMDNQYFRTSSGARNSQGHSGVGSESRSGTGSSFYSPSQSSASPLSRSVDGTDSPNIESFAVNAPVIDAIPLVTSPIATELTVASTELDSVLSNVEEEEEEDEEEEEEAEFMKRTILEKDKSGKTGIKVQSNDSIKGGGIRKEGSLILARSVDVSSPSESESARKELEQGEDGVAAETDGLTNIIQQNTKPSHRQDEEAGHADTTRSKGS